MSLRLDVQAPPDKIPEGVVVLLPFTTRQEGDATILGSTHSGRFLEVGPEGRRALDLLRDGVAWQDLPETLKRETGRDFDVQPFLRKIAQLGFVRSVGPMLVWDGAPTPPVRPAPAAWKLARHPLVLVALLGPGVVGALLLATRLDDIMRPSEMLLTPDPLLAIVLFTAVTWAMTMLHEGGHYAMARSFGITASIRLSTRLQSLVAETDVSKAWTLPKPQRAAILLGGLAVNLALLGFAELALAFAPLDSFGTFLLRMLQFANLMQIAFQFLPFIKTDGYYLLVALGPERNLRARSFRALRATLTRGSPCARCGGAEPCALCASKPATARRRRALASFGAFTLAASAAFLGSGLYYLATRTPVFASYLWDQAMLGRELGDWRIATEALVVLALMALQIVLVAYLTARPLLARLRRGAPDVA